VGDGQKNTLNKDWIFFFNLPTIASIRGLPTIFKFKTDLSHRRLLGTIFVTVDSKRENSAKNIDNVLSTSSNQGWLWGVLVSFVLERIMSFYRFPLCLLFSVLVLYCCWGQAYPAAAIEPDTVLEENQKDAFEAEKTPGIISLYRPNYVLPFYHTGSPYQFIYQGETPNNQKIMSNEFKAQISFAVPLWRHRFLYHPSVLKVAYTQLMYWQFYAKSQYFRETNYEPEVFVQTPLSPFSEIQIGLNHQSNGRGGALERSWNRVFGQLAFSGVRWYARVKAWGLVAKSQSSDLHNPQIAHYLGYENVLLSCEHSNWTLTGQLQNIESGLKRGFVMATLSYPVLPTVYLYGQFFNGYGQSLIEYDHRTTSFGVGIALNDRINADY
jgi:phospholipase A1/A2